MSYLVRDPLRQLGDSLMLRRPDGSEAPLRGLNLAAGWRATLLFCGLPPVWLLDLLSDSGEAGSLFISPAGELITHEAEALPDHLLMQIKGVFAAWQDDPEDPATRQAIREYAEVSRRTRARLPVEGFLDEIRFQPLIEAASTATLHHPDGSTLALRHASGAPVQAPSQPARLLLTLFAPLYVIEFADADGRSLVWFLDAEGTLLGDSLDRVPAPLLARITERGGRLMRQRDLGDGCFDLMRLINPRSRQAIAALFPRDDEGSRLDGLQGRLAYAAAAQRLDVVDTLIPAADPQHFQQRAQGWFFDAERCAWIVGTASHLEFEVPHPAQAFRLRLEIAVVRAGERMTLVVDGAPISSNLLSPGQTHGSTLTCFIPPERVGLGRLRIDFAFEPPLRGADAAFRLDRATLSSGPAWTQRPAPPGGALLGEFINLGATCEFGFAQRQCGLEPINLFRFAGCRGLTREIRMIETGFAGLGAPGSLRATVNTFRGEEEYMIWADAVGLFYHTWRSPREIALADLLAENETKLGYLGRKMVEAMEDADKIFLYKPSPVCDLSEMLSLHAALNRYAANRLFWVTPLEPGRRPGEVEWVAPNLLRGFSGGTNVAEEPDLEVWLTLCRNAWQAFEIVCRMPTADIQAEPRLAEPEDATAAASGAFARLRARLLPLGRAAGRH